MLYGKTGYLSYQTGWKNEHDSISAILKGIEQTEQMFEIHLTEQMFGSIMQISDKARKATHSTRRAPHMWKSDFSLNLI